MHLSQSYTFTALTLNIKIKRVSFDLDSNETSNMTQKRLQIHHDYHYYIKHYALKPKKKNITEPTSYAAIWRAAGAREKSAVAACCII